MPRTVDHLGRDQLQSTPSEVLNHPDAGQTAAKQRGEGTVKNGGELATAPMVDPQPRHERAREGVGEDGELTLIQLGQGNKLEVDRRGRNRRRSSSATEWGKVPTTAM